MLINCFFHSSLSLYFSFPMPPHHRRRTGIYPWLELISRLSTTMSPPARHMKALGRFVVLAASLSCRRGGSWWHVSMGGDTQFLAGVICGDVHVALLPALSARCQKKTISEKEAQTQIEDLNFSQNTGNDHYLNFELSLGLINCKNLPSSLSSSLKWDLTVASYSTLSTNYFYFLKRKKKKKWRNILHKRQWFCLL